MPIHRSRPFCTRIPRTGLNPFDPPRSLRHHTADMPDWLASIRKRIHLEGLHWWQIPALVVSTIAFAGLVVGIVVWLRDPIQDVLTTNVEVWHLVLVIGTQVVGGIAFVRWLTHRPALDSVAPAAAKT